MRILMSIRPYYGHFHPFVPLARSAVGAGHEVRFATAAAFCPIITAAGFQASAVGLHPSDVLPDDHEGKPFGRDYGEYPIRVKLAELLELADRLHPDVILRDPTDVAAVIAGEVLRIPHATLGFCVYIPGASWTILLGERLDAVRADFRLDPDPGWRRMHPYLYLDVVPPFFQEFTESVPVRHSIAPVTASAIDDGAAPAWLDALPSRPTVLVTLGTHYNQRPRLMRLLVEAAAQLDVSVIATVGPGVDPADVIADPPDHVRVEQFVPLSAVLPHTDLVITAGGFNTVIGALSHGLPMLVVPLGADQSTNARRVVELGVGRERAADGLTADEVTSDLRELLMDPAYRLRATRLAELCRRLPGPPAALNLLRKLAETGEPQLAESAAVSDHAP